MKAKRWLVKHGKALAAPIRMLASANVNSTCAVYAYQPKLPEDLKKLKKL